MLHFRTTHNVRQLPATFYMLLEHWKTSRPIPNAEMFADFFAIAALHNSSLEKDTMPYKIETEGKDVIFDYFSELFGGIKNGDYIESVNLLDRLFINRESEKPVKT